MAELAEGAVFAGHRIDGVAGRGGMGVVYRATHLALDHVVALKVIAPDLAHDERFRERFKRESRMAVSIRHPNVVPIHHAGEEDGVLFVTMDFVAGSDLRALITSAGGLAPERAAGLIAQVASALDAAHERGLVHRDIKPANVLIERRGEREHVFLTDFGLTKRAVGATEMTASGSFIGTLEYMAPEQIRGGDLDGRTDVYALGGVAFAALTGRAPFSHVTEDVAKLYAHLNDMPPRASGLEDGVPAAVDPVLERALAKDREDRYSTAGEFARALTAAAGAAAGEPEPTRETPAAIAALSTREAAPPTQEAPTAEDTAGPSESTAATAPEATSPAESTASARAAGPDTTPLRPPANTGRRRALGALAGLGVVALVAAGAIALTGGGDDPATGGDTGGGNAGSAAGGGGDGGTTVRTADAGSFPVGVNLDEAAGRVVVASRDDGRVFAFDTGTGKRVAESTIDGQADWAVPGLGAVWVVDMTQNRLIGLDAETLDPTGATFPTGAYPRDAAVTSSLIWVINREDDTMTKVDPAAGTAGPVAIGGNGGSYPRAIAFEEGRNRLWVSFRDSDTVEAFDAGTGASVAGPIPVGDAPHGLLVGTEFLWVASVDDDTVQRIALADPGGGAKPFASGFCDEPRDVAAGFDSIWIPCGKGGGQVAQLELADGAEVEIFDVGGSPETAVVSRDPDHVWVGGGDGGKLIEITPAR